MNKYILDKEVQSYIKVHRELSPAAMALKKSPFVHVTSSELAAQIDGWQRSVRKLPTWAFSPDIYYPDKVNLEQCSSEHTALIKQTLIQKGSIVLDMTGGFGVDSCYMAQEAALVIHCELNEELSRIVQHNAGRLGVSNLVCLPMDGIEYIRQQQDHSVDYIYIDPSRRVNRGKVFLIEDCEPNVVDLQGLFFEKAKYVICKLSPLMDITLALEQLQHVRQVMVISVDGDCKELLFVQDGTFAGDPRISAVRLFADQIQIHSFTIDEERSTLVRTSNPLTYLYDPDVSVTKAGAFKSIAKRFNLFKLHSNTHLYTSDALVEGFRAGIQDSASTAYPSFKKTHTFTKANVATKNFPVKVDDIRKKYKIRDGGSDYLFFTTDATDSHIVIHGVKTV